MTLNEVLDKLAELPTLMTIEGLAPVIAPAMMSLERPLGSMAGLLGAFSVGHFIFGNATGGAGH